MKPDWTLIANATRARLLQQERGSPMVILESFIHPPRHPKGADHRRSQAGTEAVRPAPRREDHAEFARELSHLLEQEAQLDHFRSLKIFASSPFLDELGQEIGNATRRRLVATQDVDLTPFTLSELEQRIASELAPAR
jgi:protein required for attachment to host cells